MARRKLITLSLLLLGMALAACGRASAGISQTPSNSPAEVVESFYSWYLSNLGYDPQTDTFRKPTESELETRPELSNEVLSRRLERLASFGEVGGYDPLLCAQDVPTEIRTELVSMGDGQAQVLVSTDFNNHQFTVRLEAFDEWQIVEVVCQLD